VRWDLVEEAVVHLTKRQRTYDQELLASQSVKPIPVTDCPVGWYWAGFGEDLRRGQVRPVEYMGRHFALFRSKSGEVGMLDAQCCHMGADLGHSGKVVGDRLVCGYHGWEFRTDGQCEFMPLVNHIPSRACQPTVPVIERAGNIWFWYGSSVPTKEFPDVSWFEDSSEFLTFKGERHLGHSDPLPIMEHVADVYHFQHNHGTKEPMEYVVLRNEGDEFEYQLRPQATQQQRSKVQTFFRPFAFVEMAGPCSGIYRTQLGTDINRRTPMLTVVTGVTPIREGLTVWTWRVIVRRPIRLGLVSLPLDYAFGRLLWFLIRHNVHVDVEAINWLNPNEHLERDPINAMRPPGRLSVKPDGTSVRTFQEFYRRNIAAPVVDDAMRPQAGSDVNDGGNQGQGNRLVSVRGAST
jgi:nitrite reductase/ring-hydroxylating ferredoxin subunit